MDKVFVALQLAGAVAVGYVIYVAVTKGVKAAVDLVKGWWGQTKRDVIALEARVKTLEAKAGIVSDATGTTGPAK